MERNVQEDGETPLAIKFEGNAADHGDGVMREERPDDKRRVLAKHVGFWLETKRDRPMVAGGTYR